MIPSLTELTSTFERDGAIVLPGFFSVDELRAVNAQLDAYAQQPAMSRTSVFQEKTYTDTQTWHPVEDGVASLTELMNHPRLLDVTEAILGAGYQPQGSLVMLTRQGKAQAWHQDTASSNPSEFIVNRLIYPRDTSRAAGGLVFVPGSHRMGEIPRGGPQDPIPGERLIEPRAGTLALVHSRCFHRVTPNQTTDPRFSINFRVRPANAPDDLTRVGVYRTAKWDFKKAEQVS